MFLVTQYGAFECIRDQWGAYSDKSDVVVIRTGMVMIRMDVELGRGAILLLSGNFLEAPFASHDSSGINGVTVNEKRIWVGFWSYNRWVLTFSSRWHWARPTEGWWARLRRHDPTVPEECGNAETRARKGTRIRWWLRHRIPSTRVQERLNPTNQMKWKDWLTYKGKTNLLRAQTKPKMAKTNKCFMVE